MPALIGQSVVDAGTCVVIASIGAMIGRSTALVSGLLAALWPNLIIHSTLLLTDSLFVFLFSIMLLFCLRFLRTGRVVDAAAGLLCGSAIMTRPVAQFLPFALAIAAPFIALYHGKGRHRALASALVVLCLAALPVTPLLARNLSQFGSAKLTSQGGTHLLFWVVGYSRALANGQPFETVTQALNERLSAVLASEDREHQDLDPFGRSSRTLQFAVAEFLDTPVSLLAKAWLQGAAVNLAAPAVIVDPRVRSLNRGSFYNATGSGIAARIKSFVAANDPVYILWLVIGLAFSGITLILQCFGGIVLARWHPWAAAFGALAVLYFLLINGPIASPKYRLPFEPILIVLQAIAIIAIWKNIRARAPAIA